MAVAKATEQNCDARNARPDIRELQQAVEMKTPCQEYLSGDQDQDKKSYPAIEARGVPSPG